MSIKPVYLSLCICGQLLVMDTRPIDTFTANFSRKSIQSLQPIHHSTIDPSIDPKHLWRRISNPAIMPKLQSFMWFLNNKGIWSGAEVAKWANTVIPCPRCQQPVETIEHSFWSCPTVQVFWANVLSCLKLSATTDFNWKSIVTLTYNLQPTKASITNHLTIISALWAIHSTRLASIYKNKLTDHHHIYNKWHAIIQTIIRAKHRTAVARSSIDTFRSKWQWLCTPLNITFPSSLLINV